MKKLITTTIALLLATAALPAGRGQAEERKDGMRFIPDVREAFYNLNETPEPLGFHITTTPNPSKCKHYQAIVRVNGADGTPFFLVTKSGNLPNFPFADLICDDSPGETGNGNLVVFRMDSRNKTGERMRSNRLKKGTHVNDTTPPTEDRATIFFTVAEGGLVFRNGEGGVIPPRSYRHPGGMQVLGHVLAMASEARRDPKGDCLKACVLSNDPTCPTRCNQIQFEIASSPTLVMFLDVSDPEDPGFLSQFAPTNEHGDPLTGCDGIAVTALPGGRYLLAVTGGFDTEDPIYFYRSKALPNCEGPNADPNADCTLANPNIQWEFVAKRDAPDTKDPIQALHFIREGDINGTLYLTASNGHPVCPSDDCDRINLFAVNCQTPDCAPGEAITFTVIYRGHRLWTEPDTGGYKVANLAAAAGFYESPSQELLFYATQHDNDGPNGTVEAGEWRYGSVVRGDSPTFLPTVTVDETQEVNEGSQLLLSGQAGAPITQPWMQLYGYFGQMAIVDYQDRDLDNFADMWHLEPGGFIPQGFSNEAIAWRWFAPVGCSIVSYDVLTYFHDPVPERDHTSAGTGNYELENLHDVFDDEGTKDMYVQVDGVQYSEGCDAYYGGPFTLFWDTAGDGSYAQHGDQITFDASHRDGPSTATIPVQSRHATISGPPPGQKTVTITVKNVPPAVTPLALEDGAGNLIGTDVPFVLTNAPITASVTFTDPGVADTQTATLDWGDGAVDPSSAFAAFVQATNGVVGSVSQDHVYTVPAAAVTVALEVEDDDGGVGATSATIRVVSPEQALLEMLAMLDGVIAQTTNRTTLKQLEAARKAIVGSRPPRSTDGALPMIRAGNKAAATAFVQQVAFWLGEAKARGADVTTIINIAEALIAALSAA